MPDSSPGRRTAERKNPYIVSVSMSIAIPTARLSPHSQERRLGEHNGSTETHVCSLARCDNFLIKLSFSVPSSQLCAEIQELSILDHSWAVHFFFPGIHLSATAGLLPLPV
jgi:hypothetical protein